jgi:hypothetical protein
MMRARRSTSNTLSCAMWPRKRVRSSTPACFAASRVSASSVPPPTKAIAWRAASGSSARWFFRRSAKLPTLTMSNSASCGGRPSPARGKSTNFGSTIVRPAAWWSGKWRRSCSSYSPNTSAAPPTIASVVLPPTIRP